MKTTTSQFGSKSGLGIPTSPQMAILGASQYASDNDRKDEEALNSVNNQIKRIEDSLVLGYEQLNLYVEDSDNLRKGIDDLMTQLIKKNEDVLGGVHPDLLADYKTLKRHIKDQKDENEQLYKQLLQLKKETAASQQKI